ncbi:hypothetical protein J6590_051168 [Homalodisca vitripennis]|nr:hypothetical protein J6590_051168 [Homalodisca vitripennis]
MPYELIIPKKRLNALSVRNSMFVRCWPLNEKDPIPLTDRFNRRLRNRHQNTQPGTRTHYDNTTKESPVRNFRENKQRRVLQTGHVRLEGYSLL